MPFLAIAAALVSALIHASWNAALKGGRDRLADLFLIALGSGVFGAAIIVASGAPAREAWPYLALSCVVHAAYWTCLARGYAAGDMSHVYTLARGLAPLLVTVGGLSLAHEALTQAEMAGVALISLGVLSVGVSPRAPLGATLWALATALTIAAYSLTDALGARANGDALNYVGWMSLGTAVPLASFALARRGLHGLIAATRGDLARGIGVGALSSAGFGIVIWAQTFAPIAQVTALRETSVVFGALIAWLFLKERLGARRWIGACIVAAGALLIGFG